MPTNTERVLAEVASSIRTAQALAHHRLADLELEMQMEFEGTTVERPAEHVGVPADCTRPLCVRLRQDAEALEALLCQ